MRNRGASYGQHRQPSNDINHQGVNPEQLNRPAPAVLRLDIFGRIAICLYGRVEALQLRCAKTLVLASMALPSAPAQKVMEQTAPPKTTRILCLEDNRCDRELLETTLKTDGLACKFLHAETKDEFEGALKENTFDLIISDFSLPAYDGMTALAAARQIQGDTPFIFISGTIGEERAVESLKCG